ncbi:MAG: hypothetical protein ACFFED_00850 [Candidatus Thorarchaeota archaeon]
MSDEVPEREEIIRSTLITAILTSIFLILGLLFWVWSNSPDVESPLTAINDVNAFIVPLLEILFMGGMYFFMTVTVVNLRLYLTGIRAGWLDIILLLIVQVVISYLMFGLEVTGASFVVCLAFIAYLYLLQE